MPRRVKSGVRRKLDPDVLQMVDTIIAGATGKAELANSPVTLVQLGTLKTQGQAALDAETQANTDQALARTERLEMFEEIRQAIDGFAQHAGTVYKHNKASLLAVGLDVSSDPLPPGPLLTPVNLQSFIGDLEGTIHLQWERSIRRDYYIVECAQNANGPWTQVYGGKKTRTTCTGLTPGAEY